LTENIKKHIEKITYAYFLPSSSSTDYVLAFQIIKQIFGILPFLDLLDYKEINFNNQY